MEKVDRGAARVQLAGAEAAALPATALLTAASLSALSLLAIALAEAQVDVLAEGLSLGKTGSAAKCIILFFKRLILAWRT
ncbi:MAG: hypothetical protein AB1807_08720 [Pseudomonadota bacterium]